MKNVKYYMNNACKVLRKIGDEFSEVQVFPDYTDEMTGSEWCSECMAGSGYSSHTCEEYQGVIDYINDSEKSIVCIVENRLLADKPVEMGEHASILAKIELLKLELVDRQKLQKEWTKDIKDRKITIDTLKFEFEALKTAKNEILYWISKNQ